jgi:hypothetical protein
MRDQLGGVVISYSAAASIGGRPLPASLRARIAHEGLLQQDGATFYQT